MSVSKSAVYFVMGTPECGRRLIVRDLIQNGLTETDQVLVLLADSEKAAVSDAPLEALKNTTVKRWAWTPTGFPEIDLSQHNTVFLIADSQVSMIDQLEALKPWLQMQQAEIARVLCVVDCQLAAKHPPLRQWFDACIHFSDVVLLSKREGVENKWLSDFIAHFKDQSFPCHFVYVKKGDLPNPALLLDPTPRRISQYFEEDGAVYEIEGLETDDDEEDLDEDDTGILPPEPYFIRQRSGRRERELPDIKDYLGK